MSVSMRFRSTVLILFICLLIGVPTLALASDEAVQYPTCQTLAECQAQNQLLQQQLVDAGLTPIIWATPLVTVTGVVEIGLTDGDEPPAGILAAIQDHREELQSIAREVCTDQEIWQPLIHDLRATSGLDEAAILDEISRESGYHDLETLGNAFLHDYWIELEYAVPTRFQTFAEAIEIYPGCAQGEYKGK